MDFPIVVLISGRGSNMESLAKAAQQFRIVGVVSNKPEAPGLQIATKLGIKAVALPRSDYPSKEAHKSAILDTVQSFQPRMVALAGFMQIIEPAFITAFAGQVINIHPSLLPKFPGLDTHHRALNAQEKTHGCSVHFVDAGVDTGPIIAQASVQVLPEDTEPQLAQRVLAREHLIYPWVINEIAAGNIALVGGAVKISAKARATARSLDFIIPTTVEDLQ